ncbi:proline dehydrogenase family protein [Paenibacillus rigui]|uniref:proline dehydrogenase n=1 Tax=Paenibacillus rigui TaxID=554312 RepID=A0A229UQA5_9BACL|nr:proline dehydrogenase family protein [Paenibacillus rigui]OXM85550.1 proline dehydrogenase [Paenibacillus rigui]
MKTGSLFRRVFLKIAAMEAVKSRFERYGPRIGVRRFIAADTLEEVVPQVRTLNRQGLAVTLDYLGESIVDPALADAASDQIIRMLGTIAEHDLNAHISIKLTQLGFQGDPLNCLKRMERIVAAAQYYNNFVRIDMEDSTLTDATLELFHSLLERCGKQHVGTVIQAYLYRSPQDMKLLGGLDANVRIVKGAYREPAHIAFPRKRDVDRQFMELVKLHLAGGHYTAVATHDDELIAEVKAYTSLYGISRSQFEFQMLYGIGTAMQLQLVQEGYRVRVYTPFGRQWYPYFTRRIAERPANLGFVLRGLLRK